MKLITRKLRCSVLVGIATYAVLCFMLSGSNGGVLRKLGWKESVQSLAPFTHEFRVQLASSIVGKPVSVSESDIYGYVTTAARSTKVDPALLKAIISVESNFKAGAVSKFGARGLMQLMPDTAWEVGVKDIHDPAQNILGGAKYLRKMLELFDHDLELALAAYNAGPAKVMAYNGIPPFPVTQGYVRKVMSAYNTYRAAKSLA